MTKVSNVTSMDLFDILVHITHTMHSSAYDVRFVLLLM